MHLGILEERRTGRRSFYLCALASQSGSFFGLGLNNNQGAAPDAIVSCNHVALGERLIHNVMLPELRSPAGVVHGTAHWRYPDVMEVI